MIKNIDLAIRPGQPWPPECERDRFKTYQTNTILFEGDHDKVFNNWIKILRQDQAAILELIINFNKRLTTLWSDLLVGEKPVITLQDGTINDQGKTYFDKKLVNDDYFQVVYKTLIDRSRYGTGIFKIRWDQKSMIEAQPPGYWVAVQDPYNVNAIKAHILAHELQLIKKGVFGETVLECIKFEIHEKGRIINRLFTIKNGKLLEELNITEFFPGLAEVRATGVNEFLVQPVHNLVTSDRAEGLDDYKDIMTIVQEIEVRFDQISMVLDKHTDPGMHGPASALEQNMETGNWEYRGSGKYIPLEPGDTPPGYVTFDGKLDAAFKEIEVLMEQLYFVSETCPAAFGQLKAGLAESGSALKRLMLSPLKKVDRLKLFTDPVIKRTLGTALLLEQTQGGVNFGIKSLDDIEIRIDWKDGLPQDEREVAEVESIRTGGKATTSVKSAIKRIDGVNDDQAEKEVKAIDEEEKNAAPEMFKTTVPGTDPQPGTDPAAAAAAGTGGAV